MAGRTLDLEVRHKNRREDTFQADGDPQDADWLRKQLRGWLAGHKWAESRWKEFELVARDRKGWSQLAKVRG